MQEKTKNLDYYMKLRYEVRILKSDTGYFAEIPDLPGCMTFCEEFNQLNQMIEDAKKAWFEMSIEDNLKIPEPKKDKDFSGKFLLRLPKSLHGKLSNQAEEEGVSLNQHVLNLLSDKSSALEIVTEIKNTIVEAEKYEKYKLAAFHRGSQFPSFFSSISLQGSFSQELSIEGALGRLMNTEVGFGMHEAIMSYQISPPTSGTKFSQHESGQGEFSEASIQFRDEHRMKISHHQPWLQLKHIHKAEPIMARTAKALMERILVLAPTRWESIKTP